LKWLRLPAIHWILGVALGGVFLYASHDKILDPPAFAKIVYHYQVIGPNAHVGPLPANLLAVTLPWIEAIVGLLLVSGIWRREAAAVAGALLVTFMVAVGWALYQGIDVANCGCFSVSGEGRALGWTLLASDALMLAAAVVLTVFPPRREPLVQGTTPVTATAATP
jgi:uncharacterized membrane protein YphA (DoxX/SURF4 family)